MRQGPNLFFNVVTVLFLVLTLFVGLMVLGVATGSMEPPILAPENTNVPPTEIVLPTLTPSATPTSAVALPDSTPTAEAGQ
jgi:hypothetical protein